MPKLARFLNQGILWPIVVLAIALGAFITKPWQQNTQETISVTATGKTAVRPDVAKISASIESTNPNLDVARQQNEKKVTTIVSKLKELGVEEKDIKTEYISGGPGFEIQGSEPDSQSLIYPAPQRPNTNQLTTTLEVTIRNFDNADEVMAALTQNGATNLFGPNLTFDDLTLESAKSKARENAVENAKKQAEELAKLSGRKIGKAVKITEQDYPFYPPPIALRSEADLKEQASIIQPGQNEVTITLLVDFSLK